MLDSKILLIADMILGVFNVIFMFSYPIVSIIQKFIKKSNLIYSVIGFLIFSIVVILYFTYPSEDELFKINDLLFGLFFSFAFTFIFALFLFLKNPINKILIRYEIGG